jgi:hypothetical protein
MGLTLTRGSGSGSGFDADLLDALDSTAFLRRNTDDSLADGVDVALGTTTGSKIGTTTAQKLGFFNATPVVQPAVTADLLDSLQALGLVASGAGDTPLDLTTGAITGGLVTAATALTVGTNAATAGGVRLPNNVKISGRNAADSANVDMMLVSTLNAVQFPSGGTFIGTLTMSDGVNIALGTTTGTKIGTATSQKIGFYNATPVVQGAPVADATGGTTIDAEARAAINALISRIEAVGLIATA